MVKWLTQPFPKSITQAQHILESLNGPPRFAVLFVDGTLKQYSYPNWYLKSGSEVTSRKLVCESRDHDQQMIVTGYAMPRVPPPLVQSCNFIQGFSSLWAV
ncbi:hypothetical protein Tco_0567501 [Tanacetum coccineum]